MRLKQLKFLISLEPQSQKKIMAQMVFEKVQLLKHALNHQGQEKELRLIADKVWQFNTKGPTPEIKGVSKFSILTEDLSDLFDLESRLDQLIWDAEKSKRLVKELYNLTIEEMNEYLINKNRERKNVNIRG